MADIIEHHKGKLPHHQEAGQIISLTWRFAFTLPAHMYLLHQEMQELSEAYRYKAVDDPVRKSQLIRYSNKVQQMDEYLGQIELPGLSLCEPAVANMLITAIRFYDANLYELHAYCLMSNHLHLLICPLPDNKGSYHKTSTIVQRLKSFTAKEINRIKQHQGKVWADDYYDRFIRNEEDYYHAIEYILGNPVKAGLVPRMEDWMYGYYKSASPE